VSGNRSPIAIEYRATLARIEGRSVRVERDLCFGDCEYPAVLQFDHIDHVSAAAPRLDVRDEFAIQFISGLFAVEPKIVRPECLVLVSDLSTCWHRNRGPGAPPQGESYNRALATALR